MKHPETILLPVMMFTDYFLTVLGAIQRDKKYAQHFKTQHYELNPLWQKSIGQKKWFNLRHTLLVVITSSALIWFLGFGDVPEEYAQIMLGILFLVYGTIIGRHISNLLIFRYLAKNPDQISGEISMSHRLVASISTYQLVLVLIPVSIIAAFSRNGFAVGGVVGVVLVFIIHLRWRRKAEQANATAKSSPIPDSEQTA